MSFEILTQIISAGIISATFYILASALKDSNLKQEHPFLSGRIMKVALSGILISQFGFLLLPNSADLFWILFNTSVMVIALVMTSRYRKTYVNFPVQMADNSKFISLPSDHYLEAEPGVFLRNYDYESPALVPDEHRLIEITKKHGKDKFIAIFFKVKKKAKFPDHFHKGLEFTYITKGRARMLRGNGTVNEGGRIEMKPGVVHFFDALEYCEGVSFIQREQKSPAPD